MTGCGDKLVYGLADLPAILQLHLLSLSNLERFTHSLDDGSHILGDVRHLLLFVTPFSGWPLVAVI